MVATLEKSTEWLTRYHSTIGGSNAAATMGRARFKTPQQLWAKMHSVVVKHEQPVSMPPNDDMRRGNLFEPFAREALAEHLRVSIHTHHQDEFLTNVQYPWAHVLPDGWIGRDPVELKVPRPATVASVNEHGLPAEWYLQCQHIAALTARPLVHFAMLDPISAVIHYIPVERDDDTIASLMDAEALFMESVIASQPPSEALENLIEPDAGGATFFDAPELIDIAARYFRLKEVEAAAKEGIANAKTMIRSFSRGVSVFVVEGVGKFYDKRTKPVRSFDRDAALTDLRRLAGNDFDESAYWDEGNSREYWRGYPFNSGENA